MPAVMVLNPIVHHGAVHNGIMIRHFGMSFLKYSNAIPNITTSKASARVADRVLGTSHQ